MGLLSFEVDGFRNLDFTHVETAGITAFVSPNNYGKSNLMEAVAFAADFINASPRERDSMMAYEAGIPLSPKLALKDFYFSFEIDAPELEEYRFIRYAFSFSWIKDDGTGRRIVDERIELNSKRSGMWSSYLKRSEGQYRKSHSTRSFRSIHLDDNQLSLDVLTSIDNIDINPAIREIKKSVFAMFEALDASGRFSAAPIMFKPPYNPVFDYDDVPLAIQRLKSIKQDGYDRLMDALYGIFPEFENIDVLSYEVSAEAKKRLEETFEQEEEGELPFRIRDEFYRLSIKSAHLNQPLDVSRMSTGTKRLIWLLTSAVMASVNTVTCMGIEEVETSIHPRMLRQLLETLEECADNTPVLITSHSPYLIQYLKPSQIYIGIPRDDGIASFRPIGARAFKVLSQDAYECGMGFGEYLFELMSSDAVGAKKLARYLEG